MIFWCPAGGEVTSAFLQVFAGSSEFRSRTYSGPLDFILLALESHVCFVQSPDLRPLGHMESRMGCGQGSTEWESRPPIKAPSAPRVPVDREKLYFHFAVIEI